MPAPGIKTSVFSYPEEWVDRKKALKTEGKSKTWINILHIGLVAAESPEVMRLLQPILECENPSKDHDHA